MHRGCGKGSDLTDEETVNQLEHPVALCDKHHRGVEKRLDAFA